LNDWNEAQRWNVWNRLHYFIGRFYTGTKLETADIAKDQLKE